MRKWNVYKAFKYLSIFVFLSFTVNSVAKDVKGSKDHPLITRFADSFISAYSYTDYDEYSLATGPTGSEGTIATRLLEGEVYTIIYETATNTESIAKVMKNFQVAFEKAGIKELFSCKNEACGSNFIPKYFGDSPRSGKYLEIDPWNINGTDTVFRFWNGVLKKGQENIYINLLVKTETYGQFPVKIALDIIEEKQVTTGLVTLDPDYIRQSMADNGRAVMSGVVFDTDKATIKKESDQAIKLIAEFLQSKPELQIYIVGHTDSEGSYEHNLSLSSRRAKAVAELLTTRYKINAARMKAVGVADVAPVANNNVESGRAQNRRVEMVER